MSAPTIERRERPRPGQVSGEVPVAQTPHSASSPSARPALVLVLDTGAELRLDAAPGASTARGPCTDEAVVPRESRPASRRKGRPAAPRGGRRGRARRASLCPTPARAPQRPTALRLTRRGRLAITVSTVALLAVIGCVAHLTADRPAPPGISRDSGPAAVVVRPGETLWDIAVRSDPRDDPRAVVARIERLNALPGPSVHPGQRLVLPPAA